jgi:hypothetical protein
MHTRVLLLLALTLGGCSMSGSIPDWISDEAAGPEPSNYRFLVADQLDSVIGSRNPEIRLLEIASPRRVVGSKGAMWMVCVRTLRYPSREPRAYFTVFIRALKIIESRISVGIDQCDQESYTPFEWSVDKDNPISR